MAIRFITFILIGGDALSCASDLVANSPKLAYAFQDLAPIHVNTVRILTLDIALDDFVAQADTILRRRWQVAVREDDFLMYGEPDFI